MLCTFLVFIFSTAFLVGRYSREAPPEVRANVQEAGVQKDEALVPARLREEVKRLKQEVLRWSNKAEESRLVAFEARTALNLAIQGQNDVVTLVHDAKDIIKSALRQMDEHGNECPFYRGVVMSRHGAKWHVDPTCPSLDGRDTRLQRRIDSCRLYSLRIIPPDLSNPDGAVPMRTQIFQWLDRFDQSFHGGPFSSV